MRYPPVDRDDTADVLHGALVADPYRYLEDPDADRTRAFVAAQNAVSEPYLAALPSRPAFAALTAALLTAPRCGVPWERGGRYFAVANPGDLEQDRLLVADRLDDLPDRARVLLDPNELSSDGTVALTAARVSPDGRRLAYALSEAGSDWRTVRVRDVADGTDLPDVLRWTKWVEPTWLADGSGFLYWRYPPPRGATAVQAATAPPGGPVEGSAAFTDAMGAGELALHRLGEDPGDDAVVWTPADRDWMADPWVSAAGDLLVFTASPGTDSRTTVTAVRLGPDGRGGTAPTGAPIEVVGSLTDAHRVVGSAGDTLYLRTERDAPRGRLVAVDLADPGAPWREVLGEHATDVLVDASPARDAFAIVWSSDAAHRIELVDRVGATLAAPSVPGPASVVALNTRDASAEVLFGVTSFTQDTRSFRIDLADPGAVTALAGPVSGVAGPPVTATRRSARSSDGVDVPMTVLRRADLSDSEPSSADALGPAPTLLYGYGGFDIPVLPAFSALFTAWVAAGGVLAVANLRGGGEFGAEWHRAGMLHAKQQVFDDLYACAEQLIESGVTDASRLVVHGRSNGGLVVGAAITQRPDLFAAALPVVGVLDMLRFHLFTIGWAWTSEYGTPDDPDDFAVLAAYSPLHRIRPGTAYPPTLICTGDHDDRVVPAHSLKFGAELQRGQGGDGPVLLRVDTRAGHGLGKPVHARAAEFADQLAFAAEHTGLHPPG